MLKLFSATPYLVTSAIFGGILSLAASYYYDQVRRIPIQNCVIIDKETSKYVVNQYDYISPNDFFLADKILEENPNAGGDKHLLVPSIDFYLNTHSPNEYHICKKLTRNDVITEYEKNFGHRYKTNCNCNCDCNRN